MNKNLKLRKSKNTALGISKYWCQKHFLLSLFIYFGTEPLRTQNEISLLHCLRNDIVKILKYLLNESFTKVTKIEKVDGF